MSNMLQPVSEQPKPKILTIEDVRLALAELIGQEREYTESLPFEDEEGLYSLDVTVPSEEEGVEKIEYTYLRENSNEGRPSSQTVIICTKYYTDSFPYPEEVARYINGEWVRV